MSLFPMPFNWRDVCERLDDPDFDNLVYLLSGTSRHWHGIVEQLPCLFQMYDALKLPPDPVYLLAANLWHRILVLPDRDKCREFMRATVLPVVDQEKLHMFILWQDYSPSPERTQKMLDEIKTRRRARIFGGSSAQL